MLPCIVYCKERENKDIKANIRIRSKRIKSEKKNNVERETTEKIKKGNVRVEEQNRRRLEWKVRKNNKTNLNPSERSLCDFLTDSASRSQFL